MQMKQSVNNDVTKDSPIYIYTLNCKNSAFEIYIPYVYTFCIAMKYLMTAMGPITKGR